MNAVKAECKITPGEAVIKAPTFRAEEQERWHLKSFSDESLFILGRDLKGIDNSSESFLRLPSKALYQLFTSLSERKWTGMFLAHLGYGTKRVFFHHGHIVFAGSNVMDDRLGEILYRNGHISLEQLTDSAVKVDRLRKFGQVLVQQGIFRPLQLWHALQLQVYGIVESLFLLPSVNGELLETDVQPPTLIIPHHPTTDIIRRAYLQGQKFQYFLSSLTAQDELKVSDWVLANNSPIGQGTFAYDFMTLISSQPKVANLIPASKLIDVNTIRALQSAIEAGFCVIPRLAKLRKESAIKNERARSHWDAYTGIWDAISQAFNSHEVKFPVAEFNSFLEESLYDCPAFLIDSTGQITVDSFVFLSESFTKNSDLIDIFRGKFDLIYAFLAQLVVDLLPESIGKPLREQIAAQVK